MSGQGVIECSFCGKGRRDVKIADRAEAVHRCGAPTKTGTPCGNAVVAPGAVCHHHCPDCARIPYDKTPGVGWRARQAAHEAHQPAAS